jgi:hypothetical protein
MTKDDLKNGRTAPTLILTTDWVGCDVRGESKVSGKMEVLLLRYIT